MARRGGLRGIARGSFQLRLFNCGRQAYGAENVHVIRDSFSFERTCERALGAKVGGPEKFFLV